ncbi:MAG: 50S ribosomal protein L3 [Candidatus Sumerlaeia bacterium]|nr:50S ribosomal protein L3 [Candidatus Sumerlaeia bacterium]
MAIGILGKKLGMSQMFDENGSLIPVTLIQAGPCPVLEKRVKDRDGYTAVQLGFDEQKASRVNKPDAGRFAKAGAAPQRFVREFRGDGAAALEVGQSVDVNIFAAGEKVDITGTSRGRGFAGPRKRHHLTPGPVTHGSMYHNRVGSNGGSSFPSRTFPGKKMSGHMGDSRVTVKKLTVVKTDPENNLLIVKGSVPGSPDGYVMVHKLADK